MVERAQLGAEKLIELVNREVGGTREPRIIHDELAPTDVEYGEVFPCVDLDLQPRSHLWRKRCVEPVDEHESPLFLPPFRLSEPRVERLANGAGQLPDWAGRSLYEIDVLRVASRGVEEQLVEGCSSSEHGLLAYDLVLEHGDQRP